MITTRYEPWMRLALDAVDHHPREPDLPVGAVVVDDGGQLFGQGCHERVKRGDPTAHAEMGALRSAADRIGTWKLNGLNLVTTLEPCTMCAGAAVMARVDRVVIGSWDDREGAVCSLWDVVRDRRLNHRPEVVPEVLQPDCDALLQRFIDRRLSHGPTAGGPGGSAL